MNPGAYPNCKPEFSGGKLCPAQAVSRSLTCLLIDPEHVFLACNTFPFCLPSSSLLLMLDSFLRVRTLARRSTVECHRHSGGTEPPNSAAAHSHERRGTRLHGGWGNSAAPSFTPPQPAGLGGRGRAGPGSAYPIPLSPERSGELWSPSGADGACFMPSIQAARCRTPLTDTEEGTRGRCPPASGTASGGRRPRVGGRG